MLWGINIDVNPDLLAILKPMYCHKLHVSRTSYNKADLFNSFNRNNNRPNEAEDVQHGIDHSLDSDDSLSS